MTVFRFMHAADLHLGSPFRGLSVKDEAIARRFAHATRAAFTNLVDQAIAAEVAFVVIAGDLYDGDWKDNTVGLFFNREVARLDRAGIATFVLSGNHDAQSIITRSIEMPASVRAFDTRAPTTFTIDAHRVALHGQGFAERSATDNLALRYPAPVAGHFNIGVLHTSLTGHTAHATYAPCTVEDLASRGYDYWALGHVHDYALVSQEPAIVFPGNIQGRSVRESGPKGAVIATVEDGRLAGLERAIVDEARWASIEVDVGACRTRADIWHAVEAAASAPADGLGDRLLALRVRLTGVSDHAAWLVANRADARDEAEAACQRVTRDIWVEALKIAVVPPSAPATASLDFDLAAALNELCADPATIDAANAVIGEVAGKLPGGRAADSAPLGDDSQALLAEASALLVARVNG